LYTFAGRGVFMMDAPRKLGGQPASAAAAVGKRSTHW
jgi:hypothetical protein